MFHYTVASHSNNNIKKKKNNTKNTRSKPSKDDNFKIDDPRSGVCATHMIAGVFDDI